VAAKRLFRQTEPPLTTNSVESFFALLKRGVYGSYFHVSEAHLLVVET